MNINDPIEYVTNPDKKFSEVLKSFLAEKDIKFQELPYVLHNSNVVNQENTLKENFIKNGDEVLLYNIKDKENILKPEEGENEIIEKFVKEYKDNKFYEYQSTKTNKLKFDLQEFMSFINFKTEKYNPGIKILEHEHILVCVLTNFGWKCNLCKKYYSC